MVYNPQPCPEVTARLRGARPVSSDEDGDVLEGLVGPHVEGCHPQFPSLPTFIDGRVVEGIPLKNKCMEPKKIPYAVPLFEPGTPSWSSCEYSSNPSILHPKVEVSYPWKITTADFMNDFQVRQMAKTKSISRIRSPNELLAEGTQSNPYLTPSSPKPVAKVTSTSTSSSSKGTSSPFSNGLSSPRRER
ncbi:hypothetical protein Cgig2_015471 [Carnegiea gigantea]|uniref:Uncharacterized protein n=1 Tax=Carnegiea gigantea TaxID=171969 RepID=A0A9Q1GJI6_9CARY|nr:hypothetical protein Cgig2_015471 [Carnegiea gigantea]